MNLNSKLYLAVTSFIIRKFIILPLVVVKENLIENVC